MTRWCAGIAAVCCVLSIGCSTVTVRDQGVSRSASSPTWQQRQDFFVFGLAGTAHVDVVKICSGGAAEQMQTQQTFVDGLIGLLTIGIYTPHTAKVWCK